MKALLAVLVVCGSVWAQEVRYYNFPVEEVPDVIYSATDGGSLIHIFYGLDNEVYHMGFDTELDCVTVAPHVLRITGNESHHFAAAGVLPNGDWICVVSGFHSWPAYNYNTSVFRGNGGQVLGSFVFQSHQTDGLHNVNVVARPDSGYFIVGSLGRTHLPMSLYVYPWPMAQQPQPIVGRYLYTFPYMITSDTLDILASTSDSGFFRCRMPVDCNIGCDAVTYHWPSPWSAWYSIGMMLTPSERVLAYHGNSLYEFLPDSSIDSIAAGLPSCCPTYYLSHGAFIARPSYGFAFLGGQLTPLTLTLTRVDTAGFIPASSGIVGWNVHTGNVCFAPNGDLVTAFSGWRGWSPNQVGIAIVPWDAPLDVPVEIEPLPTSFSLSAFPNPFNSSVKIEYEIAKAGEIELAVFNTLGQKVETLFEGNAALGKHELTWSPSGSSGVYFVKLSSGDLQESRKILYLR